MSPSVNAFDIKSGSFDLLTLLLRTDDLDQLSRALDLRFGPFNEVPMETFVIDVEALSSPLTLDYGRLLSILSRCGIRAVALRHPSDALARVASQFGLAYTKALTPSRSVQGGAELVGRESVSEVTLSAGATIVDRPVRAGQQVYAKGSDLIVLAIVSAGAEVIADGNIHVYAPLRGRALAGARGNIAARIFVRSMEAELVSIAGVYRTIEQALPDSILCKPIQIYLENERLVMLALSE